MKKAIQILILILLTTFLSCIKSDNDDSDLEYVATDIILKTKNKYSIGNVFSFINLFNHQVDKITYGTYLSNLPTDSLQYVLDFINQKPYTIDTNHKTTGYIDSKTHKITIFPKLYEMNDTLFQNNWLQTLKKLKLYELDDDKLGGHNMLIHVPKGEEKEWVNKLKSYDIVEWVELNYISEIKHH